MGGSPVAPLVATVDGDGDRAIEVWDYRSGMRLHRLTGIAAFPSTLRFSSDGVYLLVAYACGSTGLRDGTWVEGRNPVFVWRVSDGQLVQRFDRHTHPVHDAVFSSDNRHVFSASRTIVGRKGKGQVLQWELDSGRVVASFVSGKGFNRGAAAPPSGDFAYSCDCEGRITRWDLTGGESDGQFGRVGSTCWAFELSPDGRLAATGSGGATGVIPGMVPQPTFRVDECARVYNVESGRLVWKLAHPALVAHLAFSPDGRWLATAGHRRPIKVWDMQTDE
jgi:WD40 repeat protein